MITHDSPRRSAGYRTGARNGPPGTQAAPPFMTRAVFEELSGELDRLRSQLRQEIAQGLRDARSYGDGSNNDEYHAVREEQMVLQARIASLEETLARAVVVGPNAADDGVAVVGSTLSIEDLGSGETTRYRLAGSHSGGRNIISAASPLGQALMGAAPGTVVTVELPSGRSRSVRLVTVELDDRAAA
jgi:transcription elongation factor GreA